LSLSSVCQGGFPRAPSTLTVGGVASAHHKLRVTLRSTLDLEGGGGAEGAQGGACAPSHALAQEEEDGLQSVAGGRAGGGEASQGVQARACAAHCCCARFRDALSDLCFVFIFFSLCAQPTQSDARAVFRAGAAPASPPAPRARGGAANGGGAAHEGADSDVTRDDDDDAAAADTTAVQSIFLKKCAALRCAVHTHSMRCLADAHPRVRAGATRRAAAAPCAAPPPPQPPWRPLPRRKRRCRRPPTPPPWLPWCASAPRWRPA
jgi:hypothetical protein